MLFKVHLKLYSLEQDAVPEAVYPYRLQSNFAPFNEYANIASAVPDTRNSKKINVTPTPKPITISFMVACYELMLD